MNNTLKNTPKDGEGKKTFSATWCANKKIPIYNKKTFASVVSSDKPAINAKNCQYNISECTLSTIAF